jgi:hypothetical protein
MCALLAYSSGLQSGAGKSILTGMRKYPTGNVKLKKEKKKHYFAIKGAEDNISIKGDKILGD